MMNSHSEVIALLLGERQARGRHARTCRKGAQRLVRDEDGRITLEDVESEEDFDRAARTTGCFIRGKAIRDPSTLEIIGYEMEQISADRALASN